MWQIGLELYGNEQRKLPTSMRSSSPVLHTCLFVFLQASLFFHLYVSIFGSILIDFSDLLMFSRKRRMPPIARRRKAQLIIPSKFWNPELKKFYGIRSSNFFLLESEAEFCCWTQSWKISFWNPQLNFLWNSNSFRDSSWLTDGMD